MARKLLQSFRGEKNSFLSQEKAATGGDGLEKIKK